MDTTPTTSLLHASQKQDSEGPLPPSGERPRLDLDALNPILGPVLAAHRASTDFDAALAVATRGLDPSVKASPGAIRLWLHPRDEKRFASLTATPRSFQRVINQARSKVAAVSSLPARRQEKIAVARCLVARLVSPAPPVVQKRKACRVHGLTPDPAIGCQVVRASADSPASGCEAMTVERLGALSPRRAIRARHALAVVALELLRSIDERGWDTALISGDWLAVRMGCKARAARAALHDCVALGWLRVVTRRPGSSGRYDLARLPTALGQVAWDHADTVDALVEGTPGWDASAEVITLATHPAVGYGLGARAWLVALSMEAGVDVAALGVAPRSARQQQQAWLAALAAHDGGTLRGALDAHAKATGADEKARDAETARRERAAARTEAVRDARAAKGKAVKGLGRLLAEHPLPLATAPEGERRVWAQAMVAAVAQRTPPPDVAEQVQRLLRGRLAKAGYDADTARGVAARIIPMNSNGEAA